MSEYTEALEFLNEAIEILDGSENSADRHIVYEMRSCATKIRSRIRDLTPPEEPKKPVAKTPAAKAPPAPAGDPGTNPRGKSEGETKPEEAGDSTASPEAPKPGEGG